MAHDPAAHLLDVAQTASRAAADLAPSIAKASAPAGPEARLNGIAELDSADDHCPVRRCATAPVG